MLLVATSKTRIKLSMEAEAAILPEGWAATDTTPRQCPVLVWRQVRLLGSHRRTVSSREPVRRSGLSSAPRTHVAVHTESSWASGMVAGDASFMIMSVPVGVEGTRNPSQRFLAKKIKKKRMLVNIQETTIVNPSKLPFSDDHVLPLSHLDTDRNLHVLFRYLRVYVNSTHHDKPDSDRPFHVITAALSSALVIYYQYAGSLSRRSNDGRLELHCQVGKGVPVIRATVDCQLSSIKYLDDEPDDQGELVEGLVPNPDQDEAMTHPMTLQITMFGCGGFVLGAAIHHSLCDGIGATQFFNVMAELARGAGVTEIKAQPVWDRQILLGPRNPPQIEFPIQEFLSLNPNLVPYSEKTGRVVREFFHVKDAWLDQLKGVLLEQSGSKFTTFEALGAFIWRARAKASKIPADEKLKFAYSINIRKLVNPPLPGGYWGNGCVPMYVQLTASDLLEQPLSKTADSIKKSKYNVSDEYVRSFIDFQELHFNEGITAGTRISGFTDWRHLGHSTVDFGWGGPVTVFPLSRHLLGSVEPCFFLPYSSASEEGKKDGFKILVYLQEDATSTFKEEMDKLKNVELGLL